MDESEKNTGEIKSATYGLSEHSFSKESENNSLK